MTEIPFGLLVLVGFIAQLIDGALGMAYGVTSTSLMLSLGLSPAAASASVHASEVITTGISGLSHLSFGNVDRALVRKLLIPGVLGAVIGAYLLTNIPENIVRPFIAVYMIIMGLLILFKMVRKPVFRQAESHLIPLGLAGGFFDAIGGGGWGPIVNSTLMARGNNPRFTIGSVNLIEFFVSLAQSITFVLTIGLNHWTVILGLILGGSLAAPFAGLLTKKIPPKILMHLVGGTVIVLGVRSVFLVFR